MVAGLTGPVIGGLVVAAARRRSGHRLRNRRRLRSPPRGGCRRRTEFVGPGPLRASRPSRCMTAVRRSRQESLDEARGVWGEAPDRTADDRDGTPQPDTAESAGELARRAKQLVQSGHKLRCTALADGRWWIPVKDVDQDARGASTSVLDTCVSDCGVVARGQLGGARSTCGGPKNVADLGAVGKRMQVRGSRSVTSGASSLLCGFISRILGCSVGIQRCDPLQSRSWRPVREGPGCVDRRARSQVLGVHGFEQRKDQLSALCCVPSHHTQFVHGQCKVANDNGHKLAFLLPRGRAARRTSGLAR